MRQYVIDTLNDPRLIEAREYHMDRLTRLFAGETLDRPFRLHGYCGCSTKDRWKDPEGWTEECLTDLAAHAELLLDREVFRPLCAEGWLYGVHFTDRVFGAEVTPRGNLCDAHEKNNGRNGGPDDRRQASGPVVCLTLCRRI